MKNVLNVGSGIRPRADAVNMDCKDMSYLKVGSFVFGDLNTKFPFSDDSFNAVYAERSLEHSRDPRFTMLEISRVLRLDGKVFLILPYFRFPYSISPFCHYTQWTYNSFSELDPDALPYMQENIELCFYTHHPRWYSKVLGWFFNLIPNIYEKSILSVLIPAPEIRFTLRNVKKVRGDGK
jgi:ubiquinone/menaquinone biosynthesis C-methylase UbiE